ncbi:WD-REPEATS-REGION domain-containing protein [Aphelenchoides fujianensis]|nr:WD-REPEATS-REGION domain-containing protein [Aphelenchoides fujianensis]
MSAEKPKGPLDSDTDDSDFRAEGSSAEGAQDFEDNESSLEEMEEDEFEGLDLEKPPSSVVTIDDEEEEDESKTSKESKASKENAKPKKARKPNSRPASKCVTFADDEDDDDEVDLPPDVPKSIDHYMPLIFWHDKKPINSVHVQQVAPPDQFVSEEGRRADLRYKICTTSTQLEVRVWELTFTKSRKPGAEDKFELGVNFVANLEGHTAPLSMAKYSPDGNLIASADMNGQLNIWKIEPRPSDFVLPKERPITDESAQFTIPPNKENWQRSGIPMRCDSDISVLAFSPCSQFVCTASLDDLAMFSVKGSARKWQQRNARHLICGMTWDPTGRYIVCMSNARRLDIFDAAKGHRLRTCYQVTIPATVVDGQEYPEDSYKLFFDQHVITLSRTPDFSPCGELLFAPAGQLESADAFTYGTYVFRRCDLDRCLPFAFYPSEKPTWTVAVSPVRYELRTDTEENICGLPYRLVFAVMCPESILFYDSQTAKPIGFVYDLTYDNLTSISWTPDGKVLAISSNEAFNMFLHIRTDELVPTDLRIERCASPPLRKLKDENAEAKTPKSAAAADATAAKGEGAQKTPTRAANSTAAASDATTPKAKPKMRKIQTFFTPTTPEAPKEAVAKEEEPKEEKS